MTRREIVAVDFETQPIAARPDYPPAPVGVALAGRCPATGGRLASRYFAWGHPTENNTTRTDARKVLFDLWRDPAVELVFQNGKFDQDVAEVHLDLPRLDWRRAHDTLFLAFLADPHSPSLSLKGNGAVEGLLQRYLKKPALARDELRDWILANVRGATPKNWGAFISLAPGGLVGRYAAGTAKAPGDAFATRELFYLLHSRVVDENGMGAAYDRERKLLPILLDAERRGIPVDVPTLERDVPSHEAYLDELDRAIRRRLRAPELDVDSKDDLAAALDKAGVMKSWKYTKTGKVSVSKDSLLEGLGDPKLLALLVYRGGFATVVRTFLRPWLEVASRTGGRVPCNWNQVRQSHAEGPADAGARTGRLSSNPNLQNIPTIASPNYERIVKLMAENKDLKLRPFPLVRNYVAAPRGKKFINRDYNQQELRILGHYEDGVLAQAYRDDPWLDVHTWAQKMINSMLGTNFSRRPIKDTGFGLIYGMGLPKLASKTGTDVDTAKTIRDAYLEIAPGIREMSREFKRRAAAKEPIRTWGGRLYHVEPPRVKNGRIMTFDYKLLNQLIQGSAADCTKEAIIILHDDPRWHALEALFDLQVHDELLGEAATSAAREAMDVMRDAMEAVEFDVPMLSEGEWGRAWGSLDDFDDRREGALRKAA